MTNPDSPNIKPKKLKLDPSQSTPSLLDFSESQTCLFSAEPNSYTLKDHIKKPIPKPERKKISLKSLAITKSHIPIVYPIHLAPVPNFDSPTPLMHDPSELSSCNVQMAEEAGLIKPHPSP